MTTLIPFDYHMHSNNSCDCRATMAEMCRSAIQKHIPEIAFTEHFNRKREDMCYEKYDPARYFRDLETCRAEFGPQGLTIKAGVEVGEMHLYRAEVDAVLNAWPYDLVLGSLHWNNGENIFERSYFVVRCIRFGLCAWRGLDRCVRQVGVFQRRRVDAFVGRHRHQRFTTHSPRISYAQRTVSRSAGTGLMNTIRTTLLPP